MGDNADDEVLCDVKEDDNNDISIAPTRFRVR